MTQVIYRGKFACLYIKLMISAYRRYETNMLIVLVMFSSLLGIRRPTTITNSRRRSRNRSWARTAAAGCPRRLEAPARHPCPRPVARRCPVLATSSHNVTLKPCTCGPLPAANKRLRAAAGAPARRPRPGARGPRAALMPAATLAAEGSTRDSGVRLKGGNVPTAVRPSGVSLPESRARTVRLPWMGTDEGCRRAFIR